jgi:zinc/manganese transport system substrate-binding protein
VVRLAPAHLPHSKVEVTPIITSPDSDPHSYEANTHDLLALSKADVVVKNGGGYDDFVDSLLTSADNTSATVLDAVDISGMTARAGGALNEHVWYDFPSVEKVAGQVVRALSAADPNDASIFRRNARDFDQQLAALEATEANIKAAHGGTGVAITEPVPLYMLQACGLENKTPSDFSEAVEEGTDVSPTVLEQTRVLFDHHLVSLLVYNAQTSGAETDEVLRAARANGIAVVPVSETLPSGEDYLGWMRHNLSAIQAALG